MMFPYRIVTSLLILFVLGCSSRVVKAPLNIQPEAHNQAIVVVPINQHQARVALWQYEHRQWRKMYGPIPAVIGRSGIAKPGAKREGDGFTPSGTFDIPLAFGEDLSIDTKIPYRQATANDVWIDDVKSPQYNQWVTSKPEGLSFEYLRREDHLYRYAFVIGYNVNPIEVGHGSAIFFHVWRNYYHPTAGCVAVSQRNMRRLLKYLNANLKPTIIIHENNR